MFGIHPALPWSQSGGFVSHVQLLSLNQLPAVELPVEEWLIESILTTKLHGGSWVGTGHTTIGTWLRSQLIKATTSLMISQVNLPLALLPPIS